MTDKVSGRVGYAETGSREPDPDGPGPSGFDPARYTNARLAYAMRHIARRANDELGSHAQGMWNAAYCNADASERAVQVFDEIATEIAHWKAIAMEARHD